MSTPRKGATGGGRKKAEDAKPKRPPRKRNGHAKEPEDVEAPKGWKQTTHGRLLQGVYIGLRRRQGATMAMIAKELDVSKRHADRVHAEMQKADLSEVLNRDAVEVVEWLISQHEFDLTLYTLAAMGANTSAELVGAVNGRERTLGDLKGLLQETAMLPRNLGTIRHTHDLQELTRLTLILVAGVGKGLVSIEQFPEMFGKIVGLDGPPDITDAHVKELVARVG